MKCHLYHHPLNALRVEYHSASKCHSTPHQVSSFFEVSTYTSLARRKSRRATLFEFLNANILDVWILDSVVSNLNHSHIHLLPKIILTK